MSRGEDRKWDRKGQGMRSLLCRQSELIGVLHLMVYWQIMRCCGMKGMRIKEKERSAIEMYIRSISDILPKGKDIRSSYYTNRSDMRNIADITELYEIAFGDKNDCN